MADEWFRSMAWTVAAQEDFEGRLARARPYNRPQYLRIKAIALRESGDRQSAITLLHRALATPQIYEHEAAFTTELLGDLAVEEGDYVGAETAYRSVLAKWPDLKGTTGTVEISLAEVLVRRTGLDQEEALELLLAYKERPQLQFDHVLFRWNLALIRIAQTLKDAETSRRAARTALELAARGPQLPKHPDVGLVRADRATLNWLRRLSR